MPLIKLNLGCGTDLEPGMVNADVCPLPGVDVVCDLDDPWPWADDTATYIKASHVFEHVDRPILFMTEAWRVLAEDGILDIRVPYWQHVFSYTDPTHKRHCTEMTFDYWVPGCPLYDSFGAAMGSGKGGANFVYEKRSLRGEQQEELQVILRKTEVD